MRYLIISQYFWPENFKINDFVSELVFRGHQVDVLTGYPNYPQGKTYEEFKADSKKYSHYEGAEIIRVPVFPRGVTHITLLINYISFLITALFLGPVKLKGRGYDIIFVFQPSPITVVIPAIYLKFIKQAPIVLWVQDLWPQTLVALKIIESKFLIKVISAFVLYLYNRCDLILAQSNSFMGLISSDLKSKKPIEYFPNWAESIFYGKKNIAPAVEISNNSDLFTILFAGNIGDAQDFPAIVDAMEMLKGNLKIRWVIVGDGRKSEWLRLEIQKRKLESAVFQMGPYPLNRMPSFFMHANALLISLQNKEAFSMTLPGKFQSYLTAGIPIIGMVNGECSDYIKRYNLGVSCAAGDPSALANSILSLIADTEVNRLKMGLSCQALSKREFDVDILMEKFQMLCDGLVEN